MVIRLKGKLKRKLFIGRYKRAFDCCFERYNTIAFPNMCGQFDEIEIRMKMIMKIEIRMKMIMIILDSFKNK